MEPDCSTPLHLAIKQNHTNITLSLLNNRANTDISNADGDQPLHIAVKNANVDLTKCLLIFDADINSKNAAGKCARHIAATGVHQDHSKIVHLLNSLGAHNCELKVSEKAIKW